MKTDTTQSRHSGLLWRSIFFPLAFVYMELLFHIAIYGSAGSSILHPLTFALACGLTLSALTSFWHRYANAAIAYLLWSIFTIYYIAQFVYYKIFRTFFESGVHRRCPGCYELQDCAFFSIAIQLVYHSAVPAATYMSYHHEQVLVFIWQMPHRAEA